MKPTISLISLVLAATLLLSVCVSCRGEDTSGQPPLASGSVIVADDSIPDRAPNITGVVTAVTAVREGVTLLVEIPGKKNTYADERVYVTVTSHTIVETGDRHRLDDAASIAPGDTVSVWYTGSAAGTSPAYATAHGVRVTARVEDMLLKLRLGGTEIMASPAENEVTATDIKPLLYGSYLVWPGEGTIHLSFPKKVTALSATATPLKIQTEGSYHLKTDAAGLLLEVPANLPSGESLVSLRVDYEEGTDYYMFLLHVR